jgi:ElaB/YqjD/DUF883 family membrane-anchored ribosome-binding protein
MTAKKAIGRNHTAAAAAGTGAVSDPASGGAAATPPPGNADAIRADIATTRAELGDSVEALAAKADVKDRAKKTVAAAKDRAGDTAQVATERAKDTARQVGETVRRRPAPLAGVLAAVAAAIGAVVVIRQRRAAQTQARTWRRWPR